MKVVTELACAQVIENVRTVALYGAAAREVARFQERLDEEHVVASRVAFYQGRALLATSEQGVPRPRPCESMSFSTLVIRPS